MIRIVWNAVDKTLLLAHLEWDIEDYDEKNTKINLRLMKDIWRFIPLLWEAFRYMDVNEIYKNYYK